MADAKPPALVGASERATLRALMDFQRESIVRKLDGLTEDEARRQLVPSGTSLLWLVTHLTMAELLWICQRFAGEQVSLPGPELRDEDTIESVVAGYRAAWARVDAVADAAPLDARCAEPGRASTVDLRWIILHLLEETARHAGHADILRELIDGSTGR